MISMDIPESVPSPKRGDLVHTNLGDRRERTWFVLQSTQVRSAANPRRFRLQMARWWELEPETRLALFRSAERRGGQKVFRFVPYKRKKKKTFEEMMEGGYGGRGSDQHR